jgi:hemerythrin
MTYPKSIGPTNFRVGDFRQLADASQLSSASTSDISSGLRAMDRLHHDLFNALDEISCSTDSNFGTKYALFVEKVELAFREEEAWMEAIDFPALGSHQEQHARVLGALHNVHTQVMFGDVALGRHVIDELLPQWLLVHISTMDMPAALAIQLARSEREALLPS